jgi:hypothetical protein
MQPGDQPFPIAAQATAWTQLTDSLHFTGTGNVTKIDATGSFRDTAIVLGIDILAVIGPLNLQHQLSLGVINTGSPGTRYFGELNQGPGFSDASVTQFDGTTYTPLDRKPLATGIHTGSVILQTTYVAAPSPSLSFLGGWPGETYAQTAAAPLYAGGTLLELNDNRLEIEIRYVVIITTAP